MKLAINHHFRFENPKIAFLAGFLQASAIFFIELVNLLVLLSSTTNLDVVMNFVQLAIIADFDNRFYTAIGNDPLKKVIETSDYDHLYIVTRTSSSRSDEFDLTYDDDTFFMACEEDKNIKKMMFLGRLKMKVEVFEEMGWAGFVLRAIYKIMRVFQVAVWFYFLPFLALLGSYLVPYYYKSIGLADVT
jgi:hypothetical protein